MSEGNPDTEEGLPRVADSMEAAVALLAAGGREFTDAQLKRAKASGCPAFRGSRVYLDEFLEWVDANEDSLTLPTGDAELDAINKDIAKEKLRKWRIENDNREGKSIPRAEAAARVSEFGEELKRVLRQKLEDEGPRRQRGKSDDELRVINRAIVDEICDALSRKEQTLWTKSS